VIRRGMGAKDRVTCGGPVKARSAPAPGTDALEHEREWRQGEAGSSCRVRSGPSTPGRPGSGYGNGCFRLVVCTATQTRESVGGITCIRRLCSGLFGSGAGQGRQTGIVPHIAALVRHASTGDGIRYSLPSKAAWPPGRAHTMMYTQRPEPGRWRFEVQRMSCEPCGFFQP